MSGKGEIYNIIATLNRIIERLDKEGIKLHAIVDKDRGNNPLSKVERIHVLPVFCMENFLISDFDCIYQALKITVGQNSLKDTQSGEQVEHILEQIINSSQLKNYEITSRLNDSLSFHISTENVPLSENDIMTELEKTYNIKKARLSSLFKEVTTLVDDFVKNKNYRELNGKNIIRNLAAHYNVNSDTLTRTLASSIINKYSNPPSELSTILSAIVSPN
jgi:hypothetical protein